MKGTLALMTLVSVMLAQTAVSAAPAVTTVPTVTTPAVSAATVATASVKDTVKVNGVEMTREQARLVIIANIKNHVQMTPEEMVAYINSLEAEANAAEVTPNTLSVGIK